MSPPTAQSTARELAELVHQFLGHQVETSEQLSCGSKESLTVANECLEQAYELQKRPTPSDRLLRIYESHIAALANAAASHSNPLMADVAGTSTTTTHPNQPPSRANTLTDSESQLSQQQLLQQQQQQQHHHHHHQQQQNQQQQQPTQAPAPAPKQHSQHPISQLPMTTRKKLSHLRAQIKRQASKQHSIGVSVHQKNFKQKLIALINKFRTDGSDFDSEEQYREALERELIKATSGRGSRAIEELFEEEIDVDGESGSGPDDGDNISETSTPKPSLRPFFSSTTLDKI